MWRCVARKKDERSRGGTYALGGVVEKWRVRKDERILEVVCGLVGGSGTMERGDGAWGGGLHDN